MADALTARPVVVSFGSVLRTPITQEPTETVLAFNSGSPTPTIDKTELSSETVITYGSATAVVNTRYNNGIAYIAISPVQPPETFSNSDLLPLTKEYNYSDIYVPSMEVLTGTYSKDELWDRGYAHPTVNAEKAISFMDDFYYRVHLIPSNISLGTIINDATYDLELWNAYFEDVSVVEIQADGAEGTQFYGVNIPQVLPFLRSINPVFVATSDGPSTINGSYTLVYDNDTSSILGFSGSRSVLWKFQPNRKFSEQFEWKTDVMKTRKGEQRVALRDKPREIIEFTHTVHADQLMNISNKIRNWGINTWSFPVWNEFHTVNVGSGDMTINVSLDLDRTWIKESSNIALYENESKMVAYQVTEVTSTSISIFPATALSWSNALLFPVRAANIPEGIKTSRGTLRDWSEVKVEFVPLDLDDRPRLISFPVYKGYQVLLDSTATTSSWNEKLKIFHTKVDNEQGRIVYDTAQDFPYKTRVLQKLLTNKKDIWDWKSWLFSLRGKQKPFFLPTWNKDFIVTGYHISGETSLNIRAIDVSKLQGGLTHILIGYKDGSYQFNTVTSIDINSETEEQLFLETALTKDTNPETIYMVCVLDFVRLNSDKIKFKYENSNVAEVSIEIMEVPE
jgi:hypothetical protein